MWTETKRVLSELNDMFECFYCHKAVKNPCTLGGCEHFFCRKCIESEGTNSCKICGIPYHMKDLQTNRQIATAVTLCSRLQRLLNAEVDQPSQTSDDGTLETISTSVKKGATVPSSHTSPVASVFDFQNSPDHSLSSPITSSPGIVAGRTRRATKIKKKKAMLAKTNKEWQIGKKISSSKSSRRRGKKVQFVDLTQITPDVSDTCSVDEDRTTQAEAMSCDNNNTSNCEATDVAVDLPLNIEDTSMEKTLVNKEPDRKNKVSKATTRCSKTSNKDHGNEDNGMTEETKLQALTPPQKAPATTRKSRRSLPTNIQPSSSQSSCSVTPSRKRRSLDGPSDSMWASPVQQKVKCTASPQISRTKFMDSPVPRSPRSPAVSKRNAKGETAIQVAVIKGDINMVRKLITEGAQLNTKDHAGWTPLHEACNHGYTEIAELLLDNGASINVPGFDNDTPLHDAVTNRHVDCVMMLVSRGASLTSRNAVGKTPLDLAVTDALKQALQTPVVEEKASLTTTELSQPMHNDRVVAVATGLSREQKSELQRCMQLLHGKLEEDFSNGVTHVITTVNKEGQCPRTMKYLQAVVTGKWIISFSWVETCLEYKSHVSEEAFEVPGNSTFPNSFAPKRGRQIQTSQLPGLFDGCHFYCHGNFEYPTPTKDELSSLIKLAGGVMLSREPKDTDKSKPTVPYHAAPGSQLEHCTHYMVYDNKVKRWEMDGQTLCRVPASFILDCVAQCKIADFLNQAL